MNENLCLWNNYVMKTLWMKIGFYLWSYLFPCMPTHMHLHTCYESWRFSVEHDFCPRTASIYSVQYMHRNKYVRAQIVTLLLHWHTHQLTVAHGSECSDLGNKQAIHLEKRESALSLAKLWAWQTRCLPANGGGQLIFQKSKQNLTIEFLSTNTTLLSLSPS